MKVNTIKPLLLIFPFDLLSHYLRCLVLARHLRLHFEIMFIYSEKYIDFIEKEGYDTFDCKCQDATHVIECARKFDFSWINEKALEPVFADQVKIIQHLKPLVVLGDTSLTLKMAAEKTGVTYISLMNGYMSKYYALIRKMSRSHPVYKYLGILSGQVLDLVTQKGEAVAFYRLHKSFKKIRSKYKLSKQSYYLDELEGDINLIADLTDLFPQTNLPGNYYTIAPLFYDTDVIYTQAGRSLDKRKKIIFVSMGSTGEWTKMLFLNDKHFSKYNIITAGDSRCILNADHIIKTPFINVHEIFHFTDLVICQGGNGTIYQALSYGIPLLCKTSNFEQEWNVAALERVNVGRSIDDINKIDDYIKLVEEWIDKKESSTNNIFKIKIKEETAKLDKIIKKVAVRILDSAVKDLTIRIL